jgi:hypothetical protein
MIDKITGEEMKKFRLAHGCIRKNNSITSRDTANHEYFDTGGTS